jgi:sarcosine oxidase
MSERFDVIIAGGGVIGSAVAYFLAAEPSFTGRIAVVEPDPTYAEASTPRSVGGIRQQYSTVENIRMSQFGAAFYREASERLAVDGERPDLGFHEAGYLMLASEAGAGQLAANHALQTREGAQIALLSPEDLTRRFPWLNTNGIAAATLGLKDEGWIDPYSLLQAFRRKARALGVTYMPDRVVGLDCQGGRVTAVKTGSGGVFACGHMVNAAGPRAAEVAAMAGIDLPVRPRKRIVYVFDCRTALPDCPLLIDSSGVYVRPESGQYICGVSPPADRDPDSLDLEPDYGLFEDVVWPALAHRVPAFESIKLNRAWAGLYAYNTLDQNAIVGPHSEIGNFLFANGFSGHGLQQSPAIGRAISELIAFGTYRSLDLGRFGFDRIARGEAIRELNVV